MGKSQSTQESEDLNIPANCKIYSQMPLASPQDLQQMQELLARRAHIMSECPYICSVASHQVVEQEGQASDLSCRQKEKIVMYYQSFDYTLADIPVEQYKFTENEILQIIQSICQALHFLYTHQIPYGDICAQNICYRKADKLWMLVDKAFLKNGISAYQKVLEGEPGFITPKQMERIRHGFIRESPQITQADDVFGLGMITLQLGARIQSNRCYRESHLRINQDILAKHLIVCSQNVSPALARLIEEMLQFQEDERIGIDEIEYKIRNNWPRLQNNIFKMPRKLRGQKTPIRQNNRMKQRIFQEQRQREFAFPEGSRPGQWRTQYQQEQPSQFFNRSQYFSYGPSQIPQYPPQQHPSPSPSYKYYHNYQPVYQPTPPQNHSHHPHNIYKLSPTPQQYSEQPSHQYSSLNSSHYKLVPSSSTAGFLSTPYPYSSMSSSMMIVTNPALIRR